MADLTNQYINTMVFAVVAGIISLMLLLLLMYASDAVAMYSPFIVTVETGLILIIGYAIYEIIAYERRMNGLSQNGTANLIAVDTCPDYWTRENTPAGACMGSMLVGPTPMGTYNRFVILGTSLPSTKTSAGTYDTTTSVPTVLLSRYNNASVAAACTAIAGDTNVNNTPWIDVRSVCDSYHIGTTSSS